MNNTWVNGKEIENWGKNYNAARFKLPQVLRRLVLGSVRAKKLSFPADEDAERRGFDGFLQVGIGNAWIPDGVSVWEIGTSIKPEEKAEGDFKKRTLDKKLTNHGDITFVFVTPHKWDYEKWCDEKKSLGFWKDVRVLDSSDLAQWLDNTPAVAAWVARLLGHKPEGVYNINVHWENLCSISSLKLRAEVFLVGREEAIETVKKWLRKAPGELQIQSQSKEDVLDFLSAYAFQSKSNSAQSVQVRTLFVETRESWRLLCACTTSMVLVPAGFDLDPQLVNEAKRNGHYVLVPIVGGVKTGNTVIRLKPLPSFELGNALEKVGFKENYAKRIGNEAGGSSTVFKRLISKGTPLLPAWANSMNAAKLAGFLLVGGWADDNANDLKTVAKITGLSESEVRAVAQQWSRCDDPLFVKKEKHWKLTSRSDSWQWLAGYVTQSVAESYFEVFPSVLAVDNPRFDLPVEERIYSSIRGKEPLHSTKLREGMAEAFALLSISGETDSELAHTQVRLPLWKLFNAVFEDGITWKRWASLDACLSCFMEAMPDAVLDALERDLHKEPTPFAGFFEEEVLFSSNSFTPLLWALQVLGWEPNYLLRVALVLGKLSSLDKGGTCSPRPFGVLGSYLFPLLPQTTAPIERRLEVLDELILQHPEVAWKLMYELLPKGMGVTIGNSQPRWRDWSLNWSRRSRIEVSSQVSEMTKRIISLVIEKPERLSELLEHLAHYMTTAKCDIFDALDAVDASKLDDPALERVCKSLRRIIHTNTRRTDAWWSLPKNQIDRLILALEKFQPRSLVSRNRWYFENYPLIPRLVDDADDRERYAVVAQARELALHRVFEAGGMRLVIQLAEVAEESWAVGEMAGQYEPILSLNDVGVIPDLIDSKNSHLKNFAQAYARARFEQTKGNWLYSLPLNMWDSEQVAYLLLGLPFESRIWDVAQNHNQATADCYWKNSRSWHPRFGIDTQERVIHEQLRVGNVCSALSGIAFAVEGNCPPTSEQIFSALEVWLESVQNMPLKEGNYEVHIVPRLIDYLQSLFVPGNTRLANLEWGFLPLLRHSHSRPQVLFGWLASKPDFYVQIVDLSYPFANGKSPTEHDKAKGEFAEMLLESWALSPVIQESFFCESTPDEWLVNVRKIAVARNQLKQVEYRTGVVFAHCSEGEDGVWPSIPLRKLIENWQSQEFEAGLHSGRFNNYQPDSVRKKIPQNTWQELIDKHSKDAASVAGRWPRTAALLREIASSYRRSFDRRKQWAESNIC